MLGLVRAPQDRYWYGAALAALVVGAWVALGVWGASTHARWLGHGAPPDTLARLLAGVGIFTVAWTLMTAAMMLPGSLPLVHLFGSLIRGRPDRGWLLAGVVAGYLVVWAGLGVAAFAGDLLVHGVVDRVPGMARLVFPAVLLAAGGYQFTALKDRCLTQCRSPYTTVAAHWRGARPLGEALRLGVGHGQWCVGCCWVLMILMFAVGVAHLGWMLALGAVMAAERATSWGRRITRPVGLALVAWAAVLLAGIPAAPGF